MSNAQILTNPIDSSTEETINTSRTLNDYVEDPDYEIDPKYKIGDKVIVNSPIKNTYGTITEIIKMNKPEIAISKEPETPHIFTWLHLIILYHMIEK